MSLRRRWSALSVVVLAFALIGCSSSPIPESDDGGGEGAAATARTSHDPPLRFDSLSAITLPPEASDSRISLGGELRYPLPVVLHGVTAFVGAPERMLAVDTERGGDVLAVFAPDGEPLQRSGSSGWVGSNSAGAPVVGEVDGRPVVLAAFTTRHAGVGTQRSRRYAEVVEVDAGTLARRWITQIEISDEMSIYSGPVVAVVVGILPGRAVVEVSQDDRHDLHLIDLKNGKIVWSKPNHGPSVVAGNVIVTVVDKNPDLRGFSLVGLASADGRELWSDNSYGQDIKVGPSGGGIVVVSGAADNLYLRMVDPTDGAIKSVIEQEGSLGRTQLGVDCLFDQKTSMVCSMDDRWLSMFDTSSRKWLWRLPDDSAGRVAPKVNFAWHGAVYGETRDGPVVIDAMTGKDREVNPGITAYHVNQYVGIGPDPQGSGVAAFRSVG